VVLKFSSAPLHVDVSKKMLTIKPIEYVRKVFIKIPLTSFYMNRNRSENTKIPILVERKNPRDNISENTTCDSIMNIFVDCLIVKGFYWYCRERKCPLPKRGKGMTIFPK
jgi:hypothetical protein